jgi:hypothetical protein
MQWKARTLSDMLARKAGEAPVNEVAADDRFINRKQAAEYLRQRGCTTSAGHLRWLAVKDNARGGPPYFKNGARVLYRVVDLELWFRGRLRRVG